MLAAEGTIALGACICLAQFENLKIALRQFLEIFNSCVNLQIAQGIAHKNPQCIHAMVYCDSLYNTCLHETGSQQQSN